MMYLSVRLVPTRRLDAEGDPYRDRLLRAAIADADRRGIDLDRTPTLHVENGASGAPDGTTLVVVYGPARRRDEQTPG